MSQLPIGPAPPGGPGSYLDELLRTGIPEIKLALGDLIDRDNTRPLPPRYARLLPPTLLVVVLRADAADALEPIAADLERELTDSCNRHGSLYDRRYTVQLRRTEDPDAPLYSVAIERQAGGGAGDQPRPEAVSPEESAGGMAREPASAAPSGIAPVDPDATRAEPAAPPPGGWEPDRWVLVVDDAEGEEREAFRLPDPAFTVGRGSDDPQSRPSIAISDAPNVSRRQLAFEWEERDGAPGFRVWNIGLNEVHLANQSLPGARIGRGTFDRSAVDDRHSSWVSPGVPVRIGEHGPTLRIEEVPPDSEEPWIDPDATVFD